MSRICVQATWDDVPHLSEVAKREMLEAMPLHQRDARSKGIPQLGSGAIYPISEADIVCDPFEIPVHFRKAYGLDVGWNRTAAIWTAVDGDNDVAYLYAEHYRGQAEPAVHVQAIKAHGDWIPGVIDPASRGRGQGDGQQLLHIYQSMGLRLEVADNSVEAGILDVWQRLSTGRLRVFKTLRNFLAEFRIYRRDEKGRLVKENDHLMDATRYLCRSGIARAAFPPREQWGRLARRKTNESAYDPSAWNSR